MRRTTLSRIFLSAALIAIFLTFTQVEGCGERYTMIESLSFSTDGSRVLASTLAARDARTPLKFYKADVSRTVSWLDAAAGKNLRIIHQDFLSGNRGPAAELWRLGRTSAACNPSNDQVALTVFGGKGVWMNVGAAASTLLLADEPVRNIAFSRSGRFFAASGRGGTFLLEAQRNAVVLKSEDYALPFLGASLTAFSGDERRLVIAGSSGLRVWDVAAAKKIADIFEAAEPLILALATAEDGSVIVCSDQWVRRYDP